MIHEIIFISTCIYPVSSLYEYIKTIFIEIKSTLER